jgi:hypothetical protein
MKRACVLFLITVFLLPVSRPAAAENSYCKGCVAAIVGVAVIVGVTVGVGIYLIHRRSTSLAGCVEQADNRLILTAKDGKSYELMNIPSDVKGHERLWLRGHKIKASSGSAFRVDRVSRNYGTCTASDARR